MTPTSYHFSLIQTELSSRLYSASGTKIVDLPPLELLYYASGSANMRLTNTGHSLRLDSGNCKNVVFPEIYGGEFFGAKIDVVILSSLPMLRES